MCARRGVTRWDLSRIGWHHSGVPPPEQVAQQPREGHRVVQGGHVPGVREDVELTARQQRSGEPADRDRDLAVVRAVDQGDRHVQGGQVRAPVVVLRGAQGVVDEPARYEQLRLRPRP